MKTPIFIYVEDAYLEVYETVDSAEGLLEAIDVEDGLFRGFDAQGRLLNIEPYKSMARITLAEQQPTHQQELIELLKAFVKKKDPNFPIEDDLDYLVNNIPYHYTG